MKHIDSIVLASAIFGVACGGGGTSNHGTDGGASSGGASSGGASSGGASSGGASSGGASSGGASSGNGGSGSGGASHGSGGSTSAGGAGGSGGSTSAGGAGGSGGSTSAGGAGGGEPTGTSPMIGGCPMFPANNIFNTPIDGLPPDGNSAAYMTTIGSVKIHLDLGQSEDMTKPDTYYGIPYNVVHGASIPWANVAYTTKDTADLNWDSRAESDCAVGNAHSFVSPCTTAAAPSPVLPIPSGVLVEGGVFPDVVGQAYGDHHILLIDQDACRLWEAYHAYTGTGGTWDIYGSASFDLTSNALRPAGWTSADAAGFPIAPLLLKADEASSGKILHALRFTIDSSSIRTSYVWPARHLTSNGTGSTNLPPMGQLFRIKSSYQIPSNYSVQSKAILTALKTYGVYLADGGSNLYIQGEPSSSWSDAIFDEVQSVTSAEFEAVDLTPITSRAGFDSNSGAVPP